jgi:hypothetical protein
MKPRTAVEKYGAVKALDGGYEAIKLIVMKSIVCVIYLGVYCRAWVTQHKHFHHRLNSVFQGEHSITHGYARHTWPECSLRRATESLHDFCRTLEVIAAAQENEDWTCATCTLINPGDSAKCSVCEVARPSLEESAAPTPVVSATMPTLQESPPPVSTSSAASSAEKVPTEQVPNCLAILSKLCLCGCVCQPFAKRREPKRVPRSFGRGPLHITERKTPDHSKKHMKKKHKKRAQQHKEVLFQKCLTFMCNYA